MPAYNATNRSLGRRQRSTSSSSNNNQKSMNVAQAKSKFVDSVALGVTVLMKDCGYSRERATIALLREIARGDSSCSPPGEEEIFETMHSHGLSMEAATRALTVSKALQRQIAERNISMVEAIDDLTSKLSFANLVRMESQSATTSYEEDDIPVAAAARIQPVSVLPPTTSTTTTHVQRSKPTTSTTSATPAANTTTTTPSARKGKANAKKGKPAHFTNTTTGSNANNNNNTAAGRKRTMDDTNQQQPVDSPNKPRTRSDSVSEEVNAKLAENKAKLTSSTSDDEGSRTVVPGAASAVRSKRGRGAVETTTNTNSSESSVDNAPSMKRTRTSSPGKL